MSLATAPPLGKPVSGLSFPHRLRARDISVRAAALALHHAPSVHYTQGSRRWEGIAHHLKYWKGEYPHYADCSAFVTWCLWNALDHFGVRDVVNGEHWRAGYTGTMLNHGKKVNGRIAPGDAIIYGSGWPGEHTALYVGRGLVISHGSEAGPFLLPMRYRRDVIAVRRYI